MYKEVLGVTSGILAGIAAIHYLIDIVKKRARPERASWFIWLVLSTIALFGQLAEGATWSVWLTVFDTLTVLVIFLVSIKYGEGGFTKRDIIGLIAAALGLVGWYITRQAVIAILFVVAVDISGTSLTIIKTWKEPSSETYPLWIILSFASLLSMLSVGNWNYVVLLYPAYIFIANLSVAITKFIAENRLKKLKP